MNSNRTYTCHLYCSRCCWTAAQTDGGKAMDSYEIGYLRGIINNANGQPARQSSSRSDRPALCLQHKLVRPSPQSPSLDSPIGQTFEHKYSNYLLESGHEVLELLLFCATKLCTSRVTAAVAAPPSLIVTISQGDILITKV